MLFDRTGQIDLPETGPLAWYPNRDSLPYMGLYGLEEAETFIRTTLRYPAFCRAWSSLVRAGLTTEGREIRKEAQTIADWSAPILPSVNNDNRELLEFLGLFEPLPIPSGARTSADVLQFLLETRLAMQPRDKDMIVMQHEIGFMRDGKRCLEKSTLVVKGEDHLHTAMARTVGLPLGIAAKLLLEGKIRLRGLHIPILSELYTPVLQELEQQGIRFDRTVS